MLRPLVIVKSPATKLVNVKAEAAVAVVVDEVAAVVAAAVDTTRRVAVEAVPHDTNRSTVNLTKNSKAKSYALRFFRWVSEF